MNRKSFVGYLAVLTAVAALAAPYAARAQTTISEDFTGSATSNPWWYFNGACLTAAPASQAGGEPSSSNPTIPGCAAIGIGGSGPLYYNENLVGGQNGVSGNSQTLPDPANQGALRFTNGNLGATNSCNASGGCQQNGAIVSTTPFSTSQGVSITFKTVTYRGNYGGAGGDGADGISFYLLDSSKLNTSTITGVASGDGNGLGAWGGSLGYSCSNSNPPYNGLIGGYIAVGIDEYGNFLNGTSNTLGETGTSATGDNTATGGGYQPGRIGLRGAGSIAFNSLTDAYGVNPGSSSLPYYPATLATSCLNAGGTYNSSTLRCENCSSGSYNSGRNQCDSCSGGTTYNSGTNSCSATTTCSSGTYSGGECIDICTTGAYDSTTGTCESCAGGYNYTANSDNGGAGACCPSSKSYHAGTDKCGTGGSAVTPTAPNGTTATTAAPVNGSLTSNSPSAGYPDSYYAVQNTCATGNLYNYSTANNPQSAGPASLTNSGNTAKLLDYAAITTSTGGAYVVLPTGTQIANESAMSRGAATPIFYDLTITQNGLLSLSYSLNSGSSYQPVISAVPITSSNGSLPADFLFGFAGSTGGSSNIHEILCFKAAPNTTSASSAGASQRQSAQYETGELAYFAYYNPGNWTGTVTASKLGIGPDNNIVVASTPSWDAGCVLTGVSSTTTTCATTGLALQNAVPTPANRAVLSWNGSTGVPFEWNNMTTAQQNLLDNGDSTLYAGNPVWSALGANADPARLNFLRGDRTNEIVSTASGPSGLFRARTDLIADIVDSSPTWVGPPLASFPGTWLDRLYTTASPGENTTGAESYSTYAGASGQGGRLNVVYIGSNDGLVHGFRSGTFNAATGVYTAAGTVPNDGQEVLAYMPAAVVQTIHQYAASPPATASADADVDYSNTQYEHNFFVDATPGTGDLFYGNQWHTWLVGGLGPGGSALYALDVSDPTQFSEGHASSLVVGEWTPSSISCTNVGSCGSSMGQTYGTPAIRRLHDGNWGVIFGNGYGSATGDAGIYVMIIPSSSTGVPSPTIYYLSTSTGSASSPNGIAYTAAADLDGDHITDYVYAGDLQGNIWRFDLTSQTEANWKVSPGPLFKTPSGQPVTTNLVVASGTPAGSNQQYLMVMFGTGQKTPMTQSSAATYSSGTQSLYGVWDWNLSASDGGEDGPGSGHPQGWDGVSGAQYASLTQANTGLSSPYTLSQSNLLQQVVTLNSIQITVGTTTTTYYNRDISSNANVCWKGTSTSGCSVNNQFGWYLNLPGTQEQIVFNPELVQQALTVNSIVPAQLDATSCTIPTDTGYTYVLNAMSGGKFNEVFLPSNEASDSTFNTDPRYTDANAIGMQTNATGSSFITGNSAGTMYLVYETNSVPTGSGSIGSGSIGLNLPTNTTAKPLGWIERR